MNVLILTATVLAVFIDATLGGRIQLANGQRILGFGKGKPPGGAPSGSSGTQNAYFRPGFPFPIPNPNPFVPPPVIPNPIPIPVPGPNPVIPPVIPLPAPVPIPNPVIPPVIPIPGPVPVPNPVIPPVIPIPGPGPIPVPAPSPIPAFTCDNGAVPVDCSDKQDSDCLPGTGCKAYPFAQCAFDACDNCKPKYFVNDVAVCCDTCRNGYAPVEPFLGENPCTNVICGDDEFCQTEYCALPTFPFATPKCVKFCRDENNVLIGNGIPQECFSEDLCKYVTCPFGHYCRNNSCSCEAECVFGTRPDPPPPSLPGPIPIPNPEPGHYGGGGSPPPAVPVPSGYSGNNPPPVVVPSPPLFPSPSYSAPRDAGK